MRPHFDPSAGIARPTSSASTTTRRCRRTRRSALRQQCALDLHAIGGLSMSIVYRPARAEELPATQELIVRSINDLTERHGFGPMASMRAPDFQLFSWKDDPAGLWTAEQDGTIVGSAFSWVCGDLWFLAELFI